MRITISAIAIIWFLLTGCTQDSSESQISQPTSPDSLFAAFYQDRLQFNPIEATIAGEEGYNDTLPNYISDSYIERLRAFYTRYLEAAKRHDPATLGQIGKISLELLIRECRLKLDGLEMPIRCITSPIYGFPMYEHLPVNQIFSYHLFIGQMASGSASQPFETVEDYDNWLSRVEDYLVWIDTAIVKMREGMTQGIVHPKVITEKMIPQLRPFIDSPVEEHLFYTPATQIPDEISAEDAGRIERSYRAMVDEAVVPKYRELRDFLQEVYLPAGRSTAGFGELPGGRETYAYLIRWHTGTDMPADEIFELGKSEVGRILGEMEKVKAEVGFEGDMHAFFEHVRTSPDQMPFTDPQQVIDNFNAIHEKIKPHVDSLFDLRPDAGFEVRRTEAFRETSASAEYQQGSKDGARPGIFYVPIPDVRAYNNYGDESLFLHEAIPGHHFQLSLQQENEELPEFLHGEGNAAFAEGWALYCESLGKELGLYDDPYQHFGMLSAEMHRAIRLVVDVGIHAKGWTREEAIAYSLEHEAESKASITAEIERYMIMPAQALSYKIGQIKIQELRRRAEETLGDRFDIREFHNQVLNTGSLTLDLLEEKIQGWIEERQQE